MPHINDPSAVYYSRLLVYKTEVPTALSASASKALFTSPNDYHDLQHITSMGEVVSVQPSYNHYPVFGQTHQTPVESQHIINPVEITTLFKGDAVAASGDLSTLSNSGYNTVLAVCLQGQQYTGPLVNASMPAGFLRSLYFSHGRLKVTGIIPSTSEALTMRLLWTPSSPWVGPIL